MNSVLFVDDDAAILDAFTMRVSALGYEVFTARNTFTALQLIESKRPTLVCLDVDMPSGNGLQVAEYLAVDPKLRGTQVVVLTGLNDEETIAKCKQLNAQLLFKGKEPWMSLRPVLEEILGPPPVNAAPPAEIAPPETQPELPMSPATSISDQQPTQDQLTELVFSLLGASDSLLDESPPSVINNGHSHGPWILCVEDDADFSLILKLKLERKGFNVVRAFEGVQGVNFANSQPAEAILLDYNLPNGQGDYVLRRLKANPETSHIPVFVITGLKDQWLEKQMLHLGAARVFNKPINFEKLIEALHQHNVVAPLTG